MHALVHWWTNAGYEPPFSIDQFVVLTQNPGDPNKWDFNAEPFPNTVRWVAVELNKFGDGNHYVGVGGHASDLVFDVVYAFWSGATAFPFDTEEIALTCPRPDAYDATIKFLFAV